MDEFGHCSAQNYQNMKKGTSLTPVLHKTHGNVQSAPKTKQKVTPSLRPYCEMGRNVLLLFS